MNNKKDQPQPSMKEQEGVQNLEELQLEAIAGGVLATPSTEPKSMEEVLKWLRSGDSNVVINIRR